MGKNKPKAYLGYAILGLVVFSYYGKDYFYFDNGSGGANWKIGRPAVNFITALPTHSLPELRHQAILLVNRDRMINGLSPLVEDPLITLTAQKHADDMEKRNFYAHVNPDGQAPTERYRANGGIGGIGEKINYYSRGQTLNYGLIEKFQRSWMYSKGHRENLLNPNYTKIGYGITVDPLTGKALGVQDFQ